LGFEYRERFRPGPLRFGGSVTYTDAQTGLLPEPSKDRLRGHIDADLRLDHSGGWRSTARLNVTTDDTYLRRYDFSTEDALRSTYALEHFGRRSYFSARLWGFQGLRANDRQGLTPLVLPVIEYDYTSDPMWLGGRLSLAANGAGIIRTGGMDSQRLIGIARYDVPYLNRLGMKFLATAQVRGDLYNANDNARPDDPVYAGRDGTTGRFLPLAALEVRWPLGATGFGGFQTLEPIVQFITTSTAAKSALIPNEDSRSIDLDETNLFSLNRFTGYDRYEGGTRMAYGGRYTLDRGALGVDIQIGQSYRLDRQSVAFPSGTGLSGRFSDIVGRTTVSLGSRVDIIHRFRVDKSTLAVRRNEIDTVLSGARWQLAVGYTNLDRNIGIEDLEDLEEVRVSGRVKIARRWTLSASTIQDLTSGFDPIRYTAGLEYEDECFVFGLTWRRNLTEDRDFRKGSTFVLRIALRTLGTTQ
jgi:LPS-assembly protein